MTETRTARKLVAATMLVLAAGVAFASHHTPEESDPSLPDGALEVHTHGRIFYTTGDLSGMLEYVGRFEDPQREFRYQSVTLGGYYRLLDNLKAGLFYRLQFNARHDDDWVLNGTTWMWTDTSGRAEHLAMVDLTPRFLLDFLPGGNWVLASKFRYEFNFTNMQQTLLVRPGLTWFWIKDREPVLNISAQYATYLSLNFGAVPWYQHGPYLNVLYHVSPNLQLDVSASRQWIYWSESSEFLAAFPGATYADNIYSPWLVDVGLILRFR